MAAPRLLLDEDVRPLLAVALQRSGYDAVHVIGLGLLGARDEVLYTHNARDFMRLAAEYARSAKPHHGIIVSTQGAFGDLLRRMLRFLSDRTAEDLSEATFWLPN